METRSKMRNIATKIMAILMSAIYLTVSANVPVWAEEIYNEVIECDGTYDDDVVVNDNGPYGVYAYNYDGHSEIHFNEKLDVNSQPSDHIHGIRVTASGGYETEQAEVTVGKNYTLSVNNSDASASISGVRVESYDSSNIVTANVEIGGNATVTVNSGNSNTKGVDVFAEDDNQSNVDIDGSLFVSSAGNGSTTGINATTSNGGMANVTIGDPATTNNEVVNVAGAGTIAQGIYAEGISDKDTQGTANIIVHGDVAATTSIAGQAIGANLRGNKSGAVTNVQIDRSLSAESTGGISQGLMIETRNVTNGTTTVDIGKGISASGETADGIYIDAHGDTDTSINVGKNSDGNAITVQSSDDDPEFTVGSSGIDARLSNNASAKINVEGNIVVNSEADGARGIDVQGGVGTNLTVQVKGDVTSNGAGIYIDNPSQDTSSVDITIDGTVKSTADGIPTVITAGDIDNVSITAWKIESNEGTALLGRDAGNGISTINNSQDYTAECISYIIRVTQPEINNTPANVLSLANANGSAWNKTKAWYNGEGEDPTMLNVADENDTVYVKLDVPEGYELVGVWADAERTVELTRAENGSYFLTVPRGGGIDVNVSLTLIQTDPDPNPPQPGPNPPQPDPNPNPPAPGPSPQPNPQPSPVNPDIPPAPVPDVPVAPIVDNAKYPSVIAVPVVQYANNARLSSTMAMPNIAMPNIANANEMHNMVSIISGTPKGGTAMLAITGDRLDASVVAALLSRRDINVNIACFVNGRLSLIVIPANADLADVIEEDGSIRIARLADVFGVTEM